MTIPISLGIATAVLLAIPAGAQCAPAHHPSATLRAVQLISMSTDRPTVDVSTVANIEEAEPAATPATRPAPFTLYDPGRRWAEHQMLARSAGVLTMDAESPVPVAAPARHPRASIAAGPSLDGFSSSWVKIPAWMLGHGNAWARMTRATPLCGAAPYQPTGFLELGSEVRRQAFYGMMSRVACQYGIPVGLFDAMIIRESRYDPAIVSPKNAFGLTQLMPATAAGLGVNRYDVAQNLRGGARYLRQQLDRFGQYHLALAAYNAGPERVRGSIPAITETQRYVADILGNWARLSGVGRPRPATAPSPSRGTAPPVLRPVATLLAF